ncbi:hypothetical protein HPB51_012084 [Rhipicephalus microplus]|uniref:THAP-type domain-containing protein n=1 Tax=Rhipicephalus microplus TaxID=6941 RepID=A0A9J6D994_RHIMP|nr:hypothetical protein HPB51_012084 [Rhipicephalus microplus]
MAERRRDKRDCTCFVPYCNSGYLSCKEARSLFRVPADVVKREAWSRLIKRADRELNDASAVCDLHFEAHFIERTFKTTINEEVVEFERDRPQLAKDALPTIFPGAPTYISKRLTKKKKEQSICHQCEEHKKDVDCALALNKLVKIEVRSEGNAATVEVHLQGRKWQQQQIVTREEAEALLDHVDKFSLCCGADLEPLSGDCSSFNGKFFSKNCTITTKEGPATACIQCKYQRKLILNQLSRRRCPKRRAAKTNFLRSLRRMKAKFTKVKMTLSQMKAKNEQVPEELLFEKIKGLPQKQQAAVRTCFEAACRKSKKGMKYGEEWLLECILMRMRSPKLYEHLRRQDILTLPGRTCLNKAAQHFKSSFGFNPNVFTALKENVKELDGFNRHGVVVFDEIKVSEPIDVKPSGCLDGFVDLGQFQNQKSGKELADHGLVIVVQPFTGSATSIRSKCPHVVDDTRALHFFSDFPHLLKNVRNAFLQKGYETPKGRVHADFIKEAWKEDNKNVTLKVMPHTSRVHLYSTSFEKMRVAPALPIFSEEVLKGLFFLQETH